MRIDETRPALLTSRSGYKLDSRASVFQGLKEAGDRGVLFEGVSLTVGQGGRMASVTVGDVRVDAAFLSNLLDTMLQKFPPDTLMTLSFRKAHFASGVDLIQFCEKLTLDVSLGSVDQ